MVYLKEADIARIIAQERKWADYIIIDSSPMNIGADTELMLPYVDAILLVVRHDWSYVKDIERSIDALAKNEANFMGYVLNDFENQNPLRKKQYHYGKYGYGKYEYTTGK